MADPADGKIVRLPAGATGFGVPPPGDTLRAFVTACHAAARQTGGTVVGTSPAGVTPNFHTVIVRYGDTRIAVLGHAMLPLAALAEHRTDGEVQLSFLDHPGLGPALAASAELRVMSAAELTAPLATADLSALSSTERDQISYWAPDTVGELLFNYWD